MCFYFIIHEYYQYMSGRSSNDITPTELVLVDGDKGEIKRMLDSRWENGWRLDRIIEHGKSEEQKLLIYYFIKKY